MTKKAFHTYNIIVLLLLLSFNLLALFGTGMSQGGVGSEIWFATGASVVIWGLFYFLQFVRSNKSWRTSWFIMMMVLLYFWETGLGVKVGLMIS